LLKKGIDAALASYLPAIYSEGAYGHQCGDDAVCDEALPSFLQDFADCGGPDRREEAEWMFIARHRYRTA
jgi:hypothetical protein